MAFFHYRMLGEQPGELVSHRNLSNLEESPVIPQATGAEEVPSKIEGGLIGPQSTPNIWRSRQDFLGQLKRVGLQM